MAGWAGAHQGRHASAPMSHRCCVDRPRPLQTGPTQIPHTPGSAVRWLTPGLELLFSLRPWIRRRRAAIAAQAAVGHGQPVEHPAGTAIAKRVDDRGDLLAWLDVGEF